LIIFGGNFESLKTQLRHSLWNLVRGRFFVTALVGCLVAISVSAHAADGVVVKDLRVGVHPEKTRFVMDLTGPIEFNVFSLADPYRIVLDLPEVGWQLPARPLPQRQGLVRSLRYGLFKAGASRVVLDVGQPVKVKSAFLLPPTDGNVHRFVLDLVVTDRQTFVSNMGTPAARTAPASQQASVIPGLPQPARKPAGRGEKRVIVIDPGHGGVDPGAIGRSGVFEKNITLAAAKVLKKRLERSGKYTVHLTRDRDIFIRLRDRIAIARAKNADLFLSLHADTIRKSSIRGLSVYTLSETASDKEAAELAESENKADLIAGIDLSQETPEVTNILIDLAQRETMNESALFAADLVQELRRVTKLLRNTHRFAGFAVLKAPDVPSVLIELGFLSNRQDEKALRQGAYRARIADSVAHAIDRYFARVEQATRL